MALRLLGHNRVRLRKGKGKGLKRLKIVMHIFVISGSGLVCHLSCSESVSCPRAGWFGNQNCLPLSLDACVRCVRVWREVGRGERGREGDRLEITRKWVEGRVLELADRRIGFGSVHGVGALLG